MGYNYGIETKAQLSQYKHPEEPRPNNERKVRSKVKFLLTIFLDFSDIVHHKFLPQGSSAEY